MTHYVLPRFLLWSRGLSDCIVEVCCFGSPCPSLSLARYHIVDIFVIWTLVADLGALQRLGPDDVFHVLFVTTLMD